MKNLALYGGSPIREQLLPYGRQWIDDEDIACVIDALKSDFITQGPRIYEFESMIARFVGARFAVAFANGTAALHGACHAAGIGPGDEVITSPITFLASSNCILYQGAKPVFADICTDTYNIDADRIRNLLTPSTKAIIPVDFSGQPAEMERICRLAKENNLIVIEDAAHSLGARYDGRMVGSIADMTMFSFHPVKHVTTGEGGIIVTDNESFYNRLLLFRSHGMTKDPALLESNHGPWFYEMHELGYNYRITDLQAALGISQLRKISGFIERRKEIASIYNEAFARLGGIHVPYQHAKAESSWHLYVIRLLSDKWKVARKQVFEALRAENIGVQVHYYPVYLQPYYRKLGYIPGLCPQAEKAYEEFISLPLFPGMTNRDVADVIEAVNKVHDAYCS